MSFNFNADDSQLNKTFTYNDDSDQNRAAQRIEACVADIKKWMALNKLKRNGNKSELVIFCPRHRPPPKFSSVNVGSEVVVPADSARNIGVIFDKTMSISCQPLTPFAKGLLPS